MRKSLRMTPFILLSVYPLREGLQVGCVLSAPKAGVYGVDRMTNNCRH